MSYKTKLESVSIHYAGHDMSFDVDAEFLPKEPEGHDEMFSICSVWKDGQKVRTSIDLEEAIAEQMLRDLHKEIEERRARVAKILSQNKD